MEHVIGTIRKYETEHFTVIVDALPEFDLDLSWDEDGSTAAGLHSGKYISFIARARVLYQGQEIAVDYLGNCIYESLEQFKQPGYFSDMVHNVCSGARKYVKELQGVYIRTI